ncbi:MAG: ABC-type lipoprotein export system ATPase subunit [Maribacter sp.]|jgi:ABC-type lipoprotein export system ATPase subunit
MIHLQYIRPEPIFSKPVLPENSTIWNKEIHFKKGKKYLIRAPSGGGKSTLVHIIFGLRRDYEGEVSINDAAIHHASPSILSEIRKSQLSVVFQNLQLIPELTALENIEAARQLSDYKSKEDILQMAAVLGATDFLHQTTATLSYGQRQRIAIIRALSKPFSFLLLDEPFSHLDTANIKIACQLIQQELVERGAGLLLVSHESPYLFEIDEILIL